MTLSQAHVFAFRGAYTNPYLVLIDADTGNVIHKTNGASLAANTFSGQAIIAVQHGESSWWLADIPAMDVNLNVIMQVGDAAVPAKTDTPKTTNHYSQHINQVITPGMPNMQGRLLIRQ